MSEITIEWMALLLFLLLAIGGIIAEVMWLIRRGWATPGRSVAFVLITDTLSFAVGFLISFAMLGVMIMMVFGSSGRGGTAPESAYWVMTFIAVVVPPALLFFTKRLFLMIFGIKSGKPAWVYSLVISMLLLFVVLVPPPVAYYVAAYLLTWK
jgi:hypothetical protein